MEVVVVHMPSVVLMVMVTHVHQGIIEGKGDQSSRTMGHILG